MRSTCTAGCIQHGRSTIEFKLNIDEAAAVSPCLQQEPLDNTHFLGRLAAQRSFASVGCVCGRSVIRMSRCRRV